MHALTKLPESPAATLLMLVSRIILGVAEINIMCNVWRRISVVRIMNDTFQKVISEAGTQLLIRRVFLELFNLAA